MKTMISSTEVARHLGDCLARVKYKGERFVLTKNDKPVAELSPVAEEVRGTLGDLLRMWKPEAADPGFADDLERADSKEMPGRSPWDS